MHDVLSLVERHDEWRLTKCINLQPSENVTSPAVRRILASDMGHRYTLPINQEVHGSFVGNAYRGTRYMDEVEGRGEELARELYDAEFATLKPLSGHIAGMLMLLGTCDRGDRILVIDTKHGGYDGYLGEGMPQMFGLRVDILPFDERKWDVDSEAAAKKILEHKPKLIVLGASFILFPYDIRPMRVAADDVGALIGYDGSHVLGLIAGEEFQSPLPEGADILAGSTHKSLFGPQGGLLVCNDAKVFERVQKAIRWRVMDNAHWNRIAALTQTLLEAKHFGAEYARQVVRNAQILADELKKRGFPVRFSELGYTRCHQIHIDVGKLKRSFGLTLNDFASRLEESNIIVDAVGRLGTNEVTRMGAGRKHMVAIAGLIMRVVQGERVDKEVTELRSGLSISYCFPEETARPARKSRRKPSRKSQ